MTSYFEYNQLFNLFEDTFADKITKIEGGALYGIDSFHIINLKFRTIKLYYYCLESNKVKCMTAENCDITTSDCDYEPDIGAYHISKHFKFYFENVKHVQNKNEGITEFLEKKAFELVQNKSNEIGKNLIVLAIPNLSLNIKNFKGIEQTIKIAGYHLYSSISNTNDINLGLTFGMTKFDADSLFEYLSQFNVSRLTVNFTFNVNVHLELNKYK